MDYLQYSDVIYGIRTSLLVLNLIINGLPSILNETVAKYYKDEVLNLIINGLPSILISLVIVALSFSVLNLIINGLPSILKK